MNSTEDDKVSPAHANTSFELPSQRPLAVGTNTFLEIDAPTDAGAIPGPTESYLGQQ